MAIFQEQEINDLTLKAIPVSTDEVEIQETGGGLSKKTTIQAMAGIVTGKVTGLGTFDGLTAMRAGIPVNNMQVFLSFHTTAGDGGGGHFRAVTGAAPGTYINNNGTIIVPTGGDGSAAWLREDIGVITPQMFGAVADGMTDDSAALQASFVAANGKAWVWPKATYKANGFVVDGTATVPSVIECNGSTLLATGVNGTTVTVRNPHTKQQNFTFSNLIIDCNALDNSGLRVDGCQHSNISNVLVKNSLSTGIDLTASTGFGIYYNTFNHLTAIDCGASGWSIKTIDAVMRIASNTFTQCQSIRNKGYGFTMDYAQNTFVGIEAELNDSVGINITNCNMNDFIGGYSEGNSQNIATGGISDGSADESFSIGLSASRVKIIGGRHVGAIIGGGGVGSMILPSNATADGFSLNAAGDMTIGGSLQTGTGGLGVGATPIANGINIAQGTTYADLAVNGAIVVRMKSNKDAFFRGAIYPSDWTAGIFAGNGTPEGVITAPHGSIYLNIGGGTGTSFYVKEIGAGNTGWVAK